MFKHFLLPTDGSKASKLGIRKAMAFAQEAKARVTGVFVSQPFHMITYQVEMIEDTRAIYEKQARDNAQSYLSEIDRIAREFGVSCETKLVEADQIYGAIIDTAQRQDCDLIVMSSHGRRGVQALLLGSETQKVLTHTDIPVLVLRGKYDD
jgi:nucleotide-binding universal stress UspA family protein